MPYTATRDISYSSDAAAIFDALAQPHDSLLLESADIETKKNLNCLAVLKTALKVTCHGQTVEVRALTEAGGVAPSFPGGAVPPSLSFT